MNTETEFTYRDNPGWQRKRQTWWNSQLWAASKLHHSADEPYLFSHRANSSFLTEKMNQRLLAHRSSHSSTLATISSTVYSRQRLRGNTYNQRYTPYNELHLHSYRDKYVRKKNKQYPVCSEESNKKKQLLFYNLLPNPLRLFAYRVFHLSHHMRG